MLAAMGAPDERLQSYARLAVQVGLNLQPGQVLGVNALIEHAPLARAIARAAYEAGARYVDVLYTDQHVRRAHIELADAAELGHSPAWLVRRLRELGEIGGALCAITGNPEPELLADLDGERVGKARMREVAEASLALTDGLCNWTIVAYPNEGWAQTVFGEPDVERLWDAVGQAVRLDQPDPVAAWQEHIERLQQRAASLNERRFDHLRYRGPGTDLTIGLHPDGDWQAALDESRGIKHVANMPTEEVFTTPDARRVDGTVRSTLPLQIQGNIVRDLEVRFEDGRAVEVRAASGEDVMRTHVATDDGAARLGEVALVDGHSARRQDRPRLLRHALRRERVVAHRARRVDRAGAPLGRRALGRGTARPRRQPLVDPHRLHDRLERARGRRRDRRRRSRADPAQRRLAVVAPRVGTVGFEPTASASQRRRSDQAELRPVRRSVGAPVASGP